MEPESYFELSAMMAGPFRLSADADLGRLKYRLLHQRLDQAVDADLYAPLRRAANEAESLAWSTDYPLLVFPGLFEERARLAELQTRRQREIRAHSPRFA